MQKVTTSVEDYIEAIYEITRNGKGARVKDIAEKLGVTYPSISGILKKLVEMGLVTHQRYGNVELTPEGEKLGRDIAERHQILFDFMHRILKVPKETAQEDACGMEHSMSPETRDAFLSFIRFVQTCPKGVPSWLKSYYYFREHGERAEACEELRKNTADKSPSAEAQETPSLEKDETHDPRQDGGVAGAE